MRENLERALGRLIEKIVWYYRNPTDAQVSVKELVDALAESKDVIVIEAKVHHYDPGTTITWDDRFTRFGWPISKTENIGTPGKALAIIISEEKDVDQR